MRIAAIAQPGADDCAVSGKYARQISAMPSTSSPRNRMAGVTWKSSAVVMKLMPSTVHRPKVVVTANTPATKLRAPGTGDRRLSRLSKMTAETTPTLRTLSESRNASPASANTRAATPVPGLAGGPAG